MGSDWLECQHEPAQRSSGLVLRTCQRVRTACHSIPLVSASGSDLVAYGLVRVLIIIAIETISCLDCWALAEAPDLE